MKPEHQDFLKSIVETVPTHIGGDLEALTTINSIIQNNKFAVISHLDVPFEILVKMCMVYSQKYASYTPGILADQGEVFFASMPLVIWAPSEDSLDRCLLWANGAIFYNKDEHLFLFLDETLVNQIQENNPPIKEAE